MSAKGILIFLGGTALGGLAGYFVGKKAAEKKCDDELIEMKAFYDRRLDEEIKKINDGAHQLAENIVTLRTNANKPPLSEMEKDYIEKAENAAETGNYISDEVLENQYQEYYDELARESGEEYSKETKTALKMARHNAFDEGTTRIYEVDEKTVMAQDSEYNVEYLTYYGHEVLAYTDDDEVLHDSTISTSIGNVDILDNSYARERKDTIYIRNDKTMTDYVVVIEEQEYHEVVGHYPDD